MDATQASEQLDDVFLLDIREPGEWSLGHIPEAVHIPMHQLPARQDELPTDELIVCVCRSGHRSAMVTRALENAGYRAENLEGGMLGWISRKLPIVTDDGEPGRVG